MAQSDAIALLPRTCPAHVRDTTSVETWLGQEIGGRVRVVGAQQAPKLCKMVDILAKRASQPKPLVARTESEFCGVAGVFGGLLDKPVTIVVSDPIWRRLTAREQYVVLAHEVGHLQNNDVQHGFKVASTIALVSVAGVLAGSTMMLKAGGLEPGPLMGSFALAWATWQCAYFVAARLNHAREYRADAFAAEVCGAHEVACALLKLAATFGESLSLFSTHPPVYYRITRLVSEAELDVLRTRSNHR
jgi:Zn-dependent protease with chaperone function